MRPVLGSSVVLACASLWLAGCRDVERRSYVVPDAAPVQPVDVPARGAERTLDIGSWNLEWFGDTLQGPGDEYLQLRNARAVLAGTDLDVWGLEEIVSTEQFDSLLEGLPGYAGFVANDPSVVDGPAFYSDFDDLEQKVGLVYKTSVARVLGARVILTEHDGDFAGRPPLEVKLRVTLDGATEDVVVIVIHPKCCTDSASYERRVRSSLALKAYLDAAPSTQKVWVIGDWNDDVDTSIADGLASPYQGFVDDARYVVQSKALSDAHIGSTVRYGETIDHHMTTRAAAASYVPDSVEAYRVDAFVPGYGNTTSDHYPVLSRYSLGAP